MAEYGRESVRWVVLSAVETSEHRGRFLQYPGKISTRHQ